MTTSSKKREFRYVGGHVDDLHDGRILEPGLFYDLSQAEQDEPHNQERIAAGLLIPTKPDKEGDS